jgi:nitroreductase
MERRHFLVLMGAAAAYATLRPALVHARRLASDAPPRLQPWELPDVMPANAPDLARALIGAAVLAPSHWNTQPWRFEVEGNSIRLLADPTRALPAADPERRSMMIALGAALENMLVAARAYGLRPNVTYLPDDGARGIAAEVSWTEGDARRDRALFATIPARRTNRNEYDGRAIFPQNRAQLMAQAMDDFGLFWLDDREALRDVADVAFEATRTQARDPRIEAEHYAWMRFSDRDARRRGDGVTSDAMEYGGIAHWMPGHSFDPSSWFHRFGVESASRQARDGVRSSGGLALLTSARRGSATWLMAGQVYQRFALKATQLGIAHQPVHAPIELSPTRVALAHRFGAGGSDPLLLVRLGHARLPEHSVRRGVALVATFHNT